MCLSDNVEEIGEHVTSITDISKKFEHYNILM